MKVFLPFKPIENRFLLEIENYFQGTFFYGDLSDYNKGFDIVNIHWPEALFSWKEPTKIQLENLKTLLGTWKQHSKIVYIRHNEIPHYKHTENYRELYNIVINSANGIIHLGKYSFNELQNKTKAKQIIIHHPLYKTIPNNVSKSEARKTLGISKKAKVLLVFGKIRSEEEKELIFNTFKKLNISNKLLLIPRMQYFLPKKMPRTILVFIKYLIKAYYRLHSNYFLKYGFVKVENIQNYLSASDVVFVPRKVGLNSGNIFLGLTFRKVVVGPEIGNIQNTLQALNFPTFNVNNSNSIIRSIEKGFEISEKSFENLVSEEQLKKYNPVTISECYHNFFKELLNE